MSCGAGRRRSSNPALLWLWRGPAATALIRPLAWETPCTASTTLEKKKEKEKKKLKLSTRFFIYKNIYFPERHHFNPDFLLESSLRSKFPSTLTPQILIVLTRVEFQCVASAQLPKQLWRGNLIRILSIRSLIFPRSQMSSLN